MIRRPPPEDDEESTDRWLVSYADFITLLFAFFVVMYSISSVNQGKYNELTSSMGTAFTGGSASSQLKINTKPSPGADSKLKGQPYSMIKPLPLSHLYNEKMRREREAMTGMGVDLSNKLSPLINEGKVRVVQNNRGIRIDINDSLLFNPGSADLAGAASGVLNEIAPMIKDNQRLIQVEGHTDNIAIHNDTFFSNWELSAVRASSVVRMLSEAGIADGRLSALGFGSTQPISENATVSGRAKNRRVSIMILYEAQSEAQNQAGFSLEITPQTESQKIISPDKTSNP
ncbi:flagellar motor protein MotD [Methylotenera sp.]|uniref:flagellar motor protein MotD n=1 Tax=Methylotenera sp. TaxID=2051956 RepID=UPI002730930E|nr:flagellar motor protein MotD [Methylotenera sp.]MDP2072229.1 flagellar motor protein MotD [Methylotenera sp.]MDP3005028.1 flagellar motor protein MotD [Methylotenera sp.]